MLTDYPVSERLVLAHEGLYVNNPKDPGGPTMKGVTQRVYDAWRRNHGFPPQGVRLITNDEVAAIFKSQYWDQIRGDDLPAGLDYAVFDYAVNSGPERALEDLQRAVGAGVDGKYGNLTRASVEAAYAKDPAFLIRSYQTKRLAFMKTLRQWGEFKNGWTRRVNEVMANAMIMEQHAAPVPAAVPAPGTALTPDAGVVTTAAMAAPVVTPHPIGTYLNETSGSAKAYPGEQLAHRTMSGFGNILAAFGGAGTVGQQALDLLPDVKAQIGDGLIGHLALAGTITLFVVGGGLVAWAKWKKFQEDAGTATAHAAA